MSLTLKKPSREREKRTPDLSARRSLESEKRIVADVPERVHRQVRLRCIERGILVRDYVLALLEKDGIL